MYPTSCVNNKPGQQAAKSANCAVINSACNKDTLTVTTVTSAVSYWPPFTAITLRETQNILVQVETQKKWCVCKLKSQGQGMLTIIYKGRKMLI